MRYATLITPAGPFTTVVDDDDTVVAAGFTTDAYEVAARLAPAKNVDDVSLKAAPPTATVRAAIERYSEGELAAIDEVPVRQQGGAFIEQAWKVLRTVPPGHPVTYRDYASLCGRPAAVRAAASACARNAAALFVPCHRVIGSDGTLRGFRWGLDVKRALLAHESKFA